MALYPTVPAAVAGTIDSNGVATGIFESTHNDCAGGRKTVLTFKDLSVALGDDAGVKGWLAQKILTLADGLVVFKGAVVDLTALSSTYPAVTGVVAAWDGDFALGSIAASDDNDASPDGAEVDLVALTATVQAVAGLGVLKGISTTTEAPLTKDGTSSPFDIYLNIVIDDGDQDVTTTPTSLVLNGTVTIDWQYIGDK